MAAGTRERMLDAAIEALRRHGVAGMSFTEVLAQSGAARGAIYHHFPGGKSQLVAEAAQRNGSDVRGAFEGIGDGGPPDVVTAFLELVRPVVAEAATGCGCAVAAASLGDDEHLTEVAATAFGSWREVLATKLRAAGLAPPEADGLAASLVTILEGAQILCRAAGSVEPFDAAAGALRTLVAGLEGGRRRR